MELNEKLRQLRTARLLQQKEVAAAVGVTERAIRNYESGERKPKREILVKLADFFEIDIRDLISNEDDFLMQVQEADGARGKAAAEKLLQNAKALFAGGSISEHDKQVLIEALQESYWESKIKNKKYTRKDYRKDEEQDSTADKKEKK